MIFQRETNYVINGFGPPDKDQHMSGWGFSIGLRAEFAKKCLLTHLEPVGVQNMNKFGVDMLSRSFDPKFVSEPYMLYDDNVNYNVLLRWCRVPGNACDLGIAGIKASTIMAMDNDDLIEYGPHNVDSMSQACLLLALFLQWYNFAYALSYDTKLP